MKLMDIAKLLVVAEEMPTKEVVKEVVKESRKEEGVTEIRKVGKVKMPYTLVDIEGKGVIESLVIRATSDNYGLVIRVDGEETEMSFNYMEQVSDYVPNLSAEEDSGYYVVSVEGISFSNSVRIDAIPYSDNVFINDALIKIKKF